MADVFYQGIAFPFTVESTDLPEKAVDDSLIRAALVQLILTSKNERIMRPEFGCSAYDFVFETNDELLTALIQRTVGNAISQWEPRVIVQTIDVSREKNDNLYQDVVTITVKYVVKATQEADEVTVSVGPGQSTVEG